MPPILDVAIGTVFVFLLFSLVVTALNEIILSAFDQRAAFLKEGLAELLGTEKNGAVDASAPLTLTKFFQHGLISSLSRGQFGSDPKKPNTGVPSYIPGKSFVLAILSLVDPQGQGTDFSALKTNLDTLAESKLKESLLALYADAEKAGTDAKEQALRFRANVENWFNESMDRVGGWYKRRAQTCLFWLSLCIAAVCNVDSVRIIRALSTDPNLRQSMVQQASDYAKDHKPAPASEKPAAPTDPGTPQRAPTPDTPVPTEPITAAAPDAAKTDNPTGAPAEKPTPKQRIQNFQEALNDLGSTGIPMGWTENGGQRLLTSFERETIPTALGLWLAALAGWLVTALAASLGAPFWFDTLNRIIDIRANGRAPEEKDTTAKKRKADDAESYLQTGDAKT